jgi:hypothetical protein
MLQTCGVGCCVEEGEGKLLMLGNIGSQHGRNIVATWSQHGAGQKKDS